MPRAKKYVKDYEAQPPGLGRGRFSPEFNYTGSLWRFMIDDPALRRLKWFYALCTLAMTAIFVAIGLLDNPSSRVMYSLIPYAAMLLPLGYLWGDVYKIARAPREMTLKERDHSVVQMKNATIGVIALGAVAAVGTGIHLAVTVVSLPDVLFLGGLLGGIAFAALLLWKQTKTPCEAIPR